MICGNMNNKVISEKWPRIPAAAIVVPAVNVNVSPTKTLDGYQLKCKRAYVDVMNGIKIVAAA